MKSLLKIVLALAGVVTLSGYSACSTSSGGAGGGGSCNTSLNGTFRTACYADGGAGKYYINQFTTNGTSTFSFTSTEYNDSSCTATSGGTGAASGSITVGSASATVSGATDIDVLATTGDAGCGNNMTLYSIYKFNSDCTLSLGEDSGAQTGCGSAAARHTDIASSEKFTRQ